MVVSLCVGVTLRHFDTGRCGPLRFDSRRFGSSAPISAVGSGRDRWGGMRVPEPGTPWDTSGVSESPDVAVWVALQHARNDLAMDMENFDKEPASVSRARDVFEQGCVVIDAAKAVLASGGEGVDPTLRGAALNSGWLALSAAGNRLRDRGFEDLEAEFMRRLPREGF